ncbi:TRAP-type C4-dicarboxylate transport system, periplasmic component [Geomicrobium sp. JCM 19037]|uniref:TRAP transporter substrate-binding protein DctP n=1 Tax=Geomicrobium sp. JCM 19037 TaxID=1460634 RepID=UPI00045F35AD|nr:TRAP transporter substrate-binding protein DctP [Geomicrobium sp. JCM 19037]GAK02972.1 TRAP-type C4-dicarboxylate transport system, periplasmic component [Geomicrobium sp. JCM 19037]
MHGYTPGVFPLTEVVELPNIAQSAEESTAILQHLLEEYPEIEEEHEGTNIAWLFSVEPYQILTSNTKVENPEDLEGLKIRSPSSIANEILESLGAIPVSMPFGEVYESMQRGVIDGAYAPASVMKNYQTNEVTNYIARGDFSTANHFVVYNEDSLNALQDEDREAIENILADDWGMVAGKTYDKDEVDAWQIAEDDGIEVVHVRDNHWQVWEEAMSEVSQQWIERANALGAPGNQMYEELLNLDDD